MRGGESSKNDGEQTLMDVRLNRSGVTFQAHIRPHIARDALGDRSDDFEAAAAARLVDVARATARWRFGRGARCRPASAYLTRHRERGICSFRMSRQMRRRRLLVHRGQTHRRLEDLAARAIRGIVVGFNSATEHVSTGRGGSLHRSTRGIGRRHACHLLHQPTHQARRRVANLTERARQRHADDPWRDHLRQLLAAIHAEDGAGPIGRFISQQQPRRDASSSAPRSLLRPRLMITARRRW